ncbi:hypothetical protein ACTXT7_006150 [Hymenolepis weldensis]
MIKWTMPSIERRTGIWDYIQNPEVKTRSSSHSTFEERYLSIELRFNQRDFSMLLLSQKQKTRIVGSGIIIQRKRDVTFPGHLQSSETCCLGLPCVKLIRKQFAKSGSNYKVLLGISIEISTIDFSVLTFSYAFHLLMAFSNLTTKLEV